MYLAREKEAAVLHLHKLLIMQNQLELFSSMCKVYSGHLFKYLLEGWGKKKVIVGKIRWVHWQARVMLQQTNKPTISPSQSPSSAAVGTSYQNNQG